MLTTILRKEHKNRWERRVALTPEAVADLNKKGYSIDIEHSEVRIFDNRAYQDVGAVVASSPDTYQLVLGIKEPPVDSVMFGQTHLCFSHTIKGQSYNMDLLQRFLDQKATLIDYELMTNADGIRTIAFGRYAGIAGAIDSLWLYGRKLSMQGYDSGLRDLKQTWEYQTIKQANAALKAVDLSAEQKPVRLVILGNGKAGMGAAEVCRWLGLPEISAKAIAEGHYDDEHHWFTVLDVSEMYCRISDGGFERAEYVEQGKQTYRSRFPELLGHCDIVLQCSFWTNHYPRHMTLDDFHVYADKLPSLLGDISCDIGGSFACTVKATDIDHPVFSFEPHSGKITNDLLTSGLAVMSIDNLPCELSQNASEDFSAALSRHLPALMRLDYSECFEDLILDDELKNAIIVYQGELTPAFKYLQAFLNPDS